MSDLDDWLATRPEPIKKLAAEFPQHTVAVLPDGELLFLLGYFDGDVLIMSTTDPFKDYDGAMDDAVLVHADHLRAGKRHTPS